MPTAWNSTGLYLDGDKNHDNDDDDNYDNDDYEYDDACNHDDDEDTCKDDDDCDNNYDNDYSNDDDYGGNDYDLPSSVAMDQLLCLPIESYDMISINLSAIAHIESTFIVTHQSH